MYNIPFLDLRPLHARMEGELIEALKRTLRSSGFVLGAAVDAFEREYAEFCNSQYCVTVGNGFDALKIILLACGIGPGDEVIVPAHTFIATWLAVTEVGAKPIGVDIHPATFNLDPAMLVAAMTSRTRAIIPVHLYGRMAEMGEICRIAAAHGVLVVEDSAQAHGATLPGRNRQTYGIAAAYSFYPTKNLGALGDGGAIVTDDLELARKARMIRNYGSMKKYHHDTLGVNSRLDDIQAAFLSVKLRYLEENIAARRAAALAYITELTGVSDLECQTESTIDVSVWHLFVIRSGNREVLATHLASNGVGTFVHYPVPPHLQPALTYLEYRKGAFPIAEKTAREVISLPFWPEITPHQIKQVCSVLKGAPHSPEAKNAILSGS